MCKARVRVDYAWFNLTYYHASPGNPRDKSSPSGTGVAWLIVSYGAVPGLRGGVNQKFLFFVFAD